MHAYTYVFIHTYRSTCIGNMCIYVPTYMHVCPDMAAYIHVYIYAYIYSVYIPFHKIILYQLSKMLTGFLGFVNRGSFKSVSIALLGLVAFLLWISLSQKWYLGVHEMTFILFRFESFLSDISVLPVSGFFCYLSHQHHILQLECHLLVNDIWRIIEYFIDFCWNISPAGPTPNCSLVNCQLQI